MKKTLWAAIALVAVVAMIPLTAQGPQGTGRMGRGFGGPGVRGQGPGGPGPMAIIQRLDLTEQQREQVKALMDARRDERPGANMQEIQKQLQTALFAETIDLAKIEELKAAVASAEAAILSARIDTHVKINQILTPEQRAKARELIASGPLPGRGRRGGI